MRYIVYGAGAIGGVVGGKLAAAGHSVVLIARGLHLQALQQHGLTLQTPAGEFRQSIPAVSHPSEITFSPDDAVLLTMKSQDTSQALLDLYAAAGDTVPVFCIQNGVDNERMAARLFSRVYANLVLLPATFLEPGIVEASNAPVSAVLDACRYPAGVDTLLETVAREFEAAGLSCRPTADAMRLKYAKLITNLSNVALAVCGNDADITDVIERAREEGYRCFEAAGIDCAPVDEMRILSARMGPLKSQRAAGNSSWQSLARGAGSIEADYLNGEIVLLGRLHGVPTPVNQTLQRLGHRMVREGAQPGAISPDQLRAEIAAIEQHA